MRPVAGSEFRLKSKADALAQLAGLKFAPPEVPKCVIILLPIAQFRLAPCLPPSFRPHYIIVRESSDRAARESRESSARPVSDAASTNSAFVVSVTSISTGFVLLTTKLALNSRRYEGKFLR